MVFFNVAANPLTQIAKMSKRGASKQKLFNFNLESLFDLSPEKPQDSNTSSSESMKPPKKSRKNERSIKLTETHEELESILKEDNEEPEEVYDVSKFFQTFGNDFSKTLQTKKQKLSQFTETIISMYHSKMTEIVRKHESETDELKEQMANNIENELSKCEEEFQGLKQQESKLVKMLEQQMKLVQKKANAHRELVENFRKLQQNFIQAFQDLKMRQKNEILNLKKNLAAEMVDVQNKFIMDSKKEEMQIMKNYLNSVCF